MAVDFILPSIAVESGPDPQLVRATVPVQLASMYSLV